MEGGTGTGARTDPFGPSFQNSEWAPTCKTCTHVFFQRLSILTVDFNTSLAVYLTNDPTLENSALVLFSSFLSFLVGASFSRLAFDSFDENTRLPGHGTYSSRSCGKSRVLGISAFWSTALESGEHV